MDSNNTIIINGIEREVTDQEYLQHMKANRRAVNYQMIELMEENNGRSKETKGIH